MRSLAAENDAVAERRPVVEKLPDDSSSDNGAVWGGGGGGNGDSNEEVLLLLLLDADDMKHRGVTYVNWGGSFWVWRVEENVLMFAVRIGNADDGAVWDCCWCCCCFELIMLVVLDSKIVWPKLWSSLTVSLCAGGIGGSACECDCGGCWDVVFFVAELWYSLISSSSSSSSWLADDVVGDEVEVPP